MASYEFFRAVRQTQTEEKTDEVIKELIEFWKKHQS